MTVDEAIAYALVIRDAEDERDLALVTLAAEVRRLRAGVEAVRALITYDAELGGYKEGGPFVYRDDVLAALEVKNDTGTT